MSLPLLSYPLETQNSRVSNLAGDKSTVKGSLQGSAGAGSDGARGSIDALIETAYRQIFFHAMRSDREPFLESQLRAGNITTRDFILDHGLQIVMGIHRLCSPRDTVQDSDLVGRNAPMSAFRQMKMLSSAPSTSRPRPSMRRSVDGTISRTPAAPNRPRSIRFSRANIQPWTPDAISMAPAKEAITARC